MAKGIFGILVDDGLKSNCFQLTNRRRRNSAKKSKHAASSANLTQDMLNELNMKHGGLPPGYEPYGHGMAAQGYPDDFDVDAAWNSDRHYSGSGQQRYKVRMMKELDLGSEGVKMSFSPFQALRLRF